MTQDKIILIEEQGIKFYRLNFKDRTQYIFLNPELQEVKNKGINQNKETREKDAPIPYAERLMRDFI